MTQYSRNYKVDAAHIDFQGVVDGLYYPFYMEDCRHHFIAELLGVDLKTLASQGTNMVLTQYFVQFKRPLLKDDQFDVTCSAHPDKVGKPVFHLRQSIVRNGKEVTSGHFTATCVPSSGGRSFLPPDLVAKLASFEPSEGVSLPRG